MDPSADLPQPQVSETQEVSPTAETSPALRYYRAQREAERAGESALQVFGQIRSKTEELAGLVQDRLPLISSESDESDEIRRGVLVTSDGRQIRLKTSRGHSENGRENFSVYSAIFADPADLERNVQIGARQIRLGFKDGPPFIINRTGPELLDWGEYDGREEPPERDPLDAAREGLDYFLQHAGELRPIDSAQTPPTPSVPPTQPAPSV